MRVTGGCLCGAIRFEGEADAQFQAKCYCTDCRKTSAAGHADSNSDGQKALVAR